MDALALLIGLAIAVIVAVYVLQPLRRKPGSGAATAAPSPRQRLEAEYRTTLAAIRDLDMDFQMGKLVEQDYRALREQFVAQGVAQLQELDRLGALAAAPCLHHINDEIEAMVQARRKRRAATQPCPVCGQPTCPGDRFCSKCGAWLEARA